MYALSGILPLQVAKYRSPDRIAPNLAKFASEKRTAIK